MLSLILSFFKRNIHHGGDNHCHNPLIICIETTLPILPRQLAFLKLNSNLMSY